jgi:hypothetical protein
MDAGEEGDLLRVWRCVALILISPITVVGGLHALLLVISSACVLIDSWSLSGALSNLAQGLPAVVAIAALWFSTFSRIAWLVANRYRFLFAMTGLLALLMLEGFWLRGQNNALALVQHDFPVHELWGFGGPCLVAGVNIVALVTARNRINELIDSTPHRVIPHPHINVAASLRSVTLVPYRPPVSPRSKRESPMTNGHDWPD